MAKGKNLQRKKEERELAHLKSRIFVFLPSIQPSPKYIGLLSFSPCPLPPLHTLKLLSSMASSPLCLSLPHSVCWEGRGRTFRWCIHSWAEGRRRRRKRDTCESVIRGSCYGHLGAPTLMRREGLFCDRQAASAIARETERAARARSQSHAGAFAVSTRPLTSSCFKAENKGLEILILFRSPPA